MSFFYKFGIENIIQAVVNFSRVDVEHVRITEPKQDSFLFSLEAQVYRTGPVYATVSAMTVDLAGPTGIYGKLSMDEVKITPTETRISIKDQEVKITNMENFLALSKILIKEKTAEFSLVNGVGTVKVLGITFPMKFSKTCPVPGMAGPRTEYVRATDDGDSIIARIHNPSPLEMDMGKAIFECRTSSGLVLARQRGRVWIKPGQSEHQVSFETVPSKSTEIIDESSVLRVVGVDIDGDDNSWMKQGIRSYDVDLPMTPLLLEILSDAKVEPVQVAPDALDKIEQSSTS